MPIIIPQRPTTSPSVPSAAPPPDTYTLMAAVQMHAEGRLTRPQPKAPTANGQTSNQG